MANLSKIIKIRQEDYSTLLSEGEVIINGHTYEYDPNALYTIVDPAPPEYAQTAGYATNAGSASIATGDSNGNNIINTYATKTELAALDPRLKVLLYMTKNSSNNSITFTDVDNNTVTHQDVLSLLSNNSKDIEINYGNRIYRVSYYDLDNNNDYVHLSNNDGEQIYEIPLLLLLNNIIFGSYIHNKVPTKSSSTPLMDGTASSGTSNNLYAAGNHRHPTDTSRAPLNSPTFTGTPKSVTPATSDNSTNIATTAYVKANLKLSSGYGDGYIGTADPTPAANQTYEMAIASLHNNLIKDELAISAALNDLNDRANELETGVSGAYVKPSGGIPKTDLASAVQTSLGKADSAIQGVQFEGTTITPNASKIVNITPQLSSSYQSTTGEPTIGDSYQTAIAKLHGSLVEDEEVLADALVDLNNRIPTKTSDLTNDSGFLLSETDPTVKSWAKNDIKIGNNNYTGSNIKFSGDTFSLTGDSDNKIVLKSDASSSAYINVIHALGNSTPSVNWDYAGDNALATVSLIKNYLAPKESPTFTGTPIAPTATAGTNTTQIATTAFVQTAVSNLVNSAPATLDTLNELAAALGNDPNFATTTATALGNKANKSTTTTAGTYRSVTVNSDGIVTGGTNPTDYWANVAVGNSANYITEPEVKSVKINGSSTNAASTENAVIQYDTTNKCIKFVFN